MRIYNADLESYVYGYAKTCMLCMCVYWHRRLVCVSQVSSAKEAFWKRGKDI